MNAPRPRRLWSPLPDYNQRRLIELLLASRPDAEMLARWADDVDIQALDDGSARLLPALYLKLTAAGIDHPAYYCPLLFVIACSTMVRP